MIEGTSQQRQASWWRTRIDHFPNRGVRFLASFQVSPRYLSCSMPITFRYRPQSGKQSTLSSSETDVFEPREPQLCAHARNNFRCFTHGSDVGYPMDFTERGSQDSSSSCGVINSLLTPLAILFAPLTQFASSDAEGHKILTASLTSADRLWADALCSRRLLITGRSGTPDEATTVSCLVTPRLTLLNVAPVTAASSCTMLCVMLSMVALLTSHVTIGSALAIFEAVEEILIIRPLVAGG